MATATSTSTSTSSSSPSPASTPTPATAEENRDANGASATLDAKRARLEEALASYRLTHVVRENETRPIARLLVDARADGKDLILTVGGSQANVYEGENFDLTSHFVNAPSVHVPNPGSLTAACWVRSSGTNEMLFCAGGSEGVISVISLAQSRVVERLGESGQNTHVQDLASHSRRFGLVAALVSHGASDSNSKKYTVSLWDVEAATNLLQFSPHDALSIFNEVCFPPFSSSSLPTSSTASSAREDEEICLLGVSEIATFRRGTKALPPVLLPTKCASARMIPATEGNVVLQSLAGSISQFNMNSTEKQGLPFPPRSGASAKYTCLTVSNCGRYVAAGDAEGGAHVVDLETKEYAALTSRRINKNCAVTCVAFSYQAPSSVLCTSEEGFLWRWSLRPVTAVAAAAAANSPSLDEE